MNPVETSALIVLSYDTPRLSKRCIESIRKTLTLEKKKYSIFLIDNGSTPENSLQLSKIGGVNFFIKTKVNRGFAGGMNIGIREAILRGFNYVMLISSDTQYQQADWLHNMICASKTNNAGIVGALSNFVCEREQLIQKYGNNMPNKYIEINKKPDSFIVFINPLITRDTIKRLGYLDEIFYPINYEDNDYCMRAKLAGIKMIIDGYTFVHHDPDSAPTSKIGDKSKIMERNKQIFINKWKEEGIK